LSHPNPFSYWREGEVVDTSETLKTELNIAMGVVNLFQAVGAGIGWLAGRAFIAEAGEILAAEGTTLTGAAEGACANGLCPCFVAGTMVDSQDGGHPIEVTQLGDRVGPELEICADTDFTSWREVDLTMTVDNEGVEDELELRLLRPEAWIAIQRRTQLLRFEAWLQRYFDAPGVPWQRILRAFEGPSERAVHRFASLWAEHQK
jgi:hypothetical protein